MNTIQDEIQRIRNLTLKVESGKPLAIAVSTTVKDLVVRVFTKGEATENKIGSYNDTDPIYVNPIGSPGKGFSVGGKPFDKVIKTGKNKGTTKSVFSKTKSSKVTFFNDSGEKEQVTNVSDRKTRYFDSYKAYREKIGRPTDKVNLNLSGELKSDIENGVTKISNTEYVLALKRDIDVKKIAGNEARFGNIFKFKPEERAKFLEILRLESL